MKALVSALEEASSPEILVGEDAEDFLSDTDQDAWELASSVGVRVLRGKNLLAVAVIGEKLVGAIFDEVNGDDYSFDTVVHASHQGSGIGPKLVRVAMDNFNELQDMNPDLRFDLDVINPNAIRMMQKFGFKVLREVPGHTIMGR